MSATWCMRHLGFQLFNGLQTLLKFIQYCVSLVQARLVIMAPRKRRLSGSPGDNLSSLGTDINTDNDYGGSVVEPKDVHQGTPPAGVDKLSVLCGLKLQPVAPCDNSATTRLTQSMMKATDTPSKATTSGLTDLPQKGSTFVITKQGTVDLDK